MMRQQVAAFAGLMERKLAENDHKGGWSRDTVQALLGRLKEETKELEDELNKTPVDAAVSAFEAVDIANFAMMIVDRLTAGKLSELPRTLGNLKRQSQPNNDAAKASGHWYRWIITCQGADARVMSGRVFAASDDKAMVMIRDAAIADRVERPFEITVARIYRVMDETIQRTSEVTE